MAILFIQCESDKPGTLKWKYKTGGSIVSSPAIGHDGTIYIGSEDSCLYAFDSDGNLKWKYRSDRMIWSSPAIGADGTVYFSSRESYTYALTPDGELKWKYQTYSISSPAIDHDGTLYAAAINGHLYAITPEGKLKWESSQVKGLTIFPPAIGVDGTLYTSAFNIVYALDPLGNIKWRFEVPVTWPNSTLSFMAIDSEGNICFYIVEGGFCVLSPQGEPVTFLLVTLTLYGVTSPVINADGMIYLARSYFRVLNPDYTEKWILGEDIGYGAETTPAIGSDGIIYLGVNNWEGKESVTDTDRKRIGCLYAFTPEGKRKWRCKVGGEIKSSPTIGLDGTVYVGSADSCVYAIHSDSKGLADSPWPKFQHDNCNTGRAK